MVYYFSSTSGLLFSQHLVYFFLDIRIEALGKVEKALPKGNSIPVLNGIKMCTTHESVNFTTSDGQLTSIEVTIPVSEENGVHVQRTGGIVIPTKFIEVVKKIGKEVSISVNEKFVATIKSADEKIKSEVQLSGVDPEMFPHLPSIEGSANLSIKGKDFITLINKTQFAALTETSRPILQAIMMVVKQGALTFTATDSHRLAQRITKIDSQEEFAVPVPAVVMRDLSRVVNPFETVEITVTENQFMAKTQDMVFYTRLLNGTYPDVNRVIPNTHKSKATINRQEMIDALDRLTIVSDDKKKQTTRMKIEGQTLELNTHLHDGSAKGQELIFVSAFEGEEISISFNAKYMLDALRAMDTNQVELRFLNGMSPMLIVPEKEEDELHLVLPQRTA